MANDRLEPWRAATMLLAVLLLVAHPLPALSDPESQGSVPEPVQAFFERIPAKLEGWRPEGTEGAIAIQMLPAVGREDLVDRFGQRRPRGRTCPPLPGEPLSVLAEAATEAQIVIVSEAHDQPLHRHVIQRLGLLLAHDFDWFAAETFSHEAVAARRPGQVTLALGSYSDEPVFGRELRALDEAGYRFVAYEILARQRKRNDADIAEQVIAREEAQAENLIAGVLADHPGARILVHVGYSHALEVAVDNFGREIEWFAARLKHKTGIDPLTISQTHCALDSSSASNAIDGLRLADGAEAVERDGAIDRFLAHPPLQFEDGRPAWRRAIGDIAVDVPEAMRSRQQRVIVEARTPAQRADEVPSDRLMLYPGESLPLLLPAGKWRLTGWREDGSRLAAVEVRLGAEADPNRTPLPANGD